MPTTTDGQFAARFPGISAATFVANQADLSSFVPTSSALHTGMMSDIGRAMVYGPDIQRSFFDRFMRAPLSRGDSVLKARFEEVSSVAYDPLSANTALFSGQRPNMLSNVATKNLSRQIAVEINDYYMKQMVQTEDMIGDVMASLMGLSYAAYRDDMWVAAKEYFSNPAGTLLAGQEQIMTAIRGGVNYLDTAYIYPVGLLREQVQVQEHRLQRGRIQHQGGIRIHHHEEERGVPRIQEALLGHLQPRVPGHPRDHRLRR